jgi:hypothetical protein
MYTSDISPVMIGKSGFTLSFPADSPWDIHQGFHRRTAIPYPGILQPCPTLYPQPCDIFD